MTMLAVVLDANILISARLTPRGEGAAVLESARSHKLYWSELIAPKTSPGDRAVPHETSLLANFRVHF